jgi:uncharacterized membrane protein YeiH
MDASLPIVIVSGMVTGCAGGVLRDILCNEVEQAILTQNSA